MGRYIGLIILTQVLLFSQSSLASDTDAKTDLILKCHQSAAVYEPEQPILYDVMIADSHLGRDQKTNIALDITNIHGLSVYQKNFEVAAGTSIPLSLSIEQYGFFRIQVRLVQNGNVKGQTTSSFVILPKAVAVSNEKNPFGVNFHLTRIPLADAAKEIEMAKRIGLGWGRGMLFDWSDVCAPRNGSYNYEFKRYESLINLVRQSGLSVLGSIFFVPRWASSAPENADYIVWSRMIPDDLNEMRSFCKEYAEQCGDFIHYWEVGNEVDADLFWKGRFRHFREGNDQGIIVDYVDFLKAGYEGFRQGNSVARVLFAGLTSGAPEGGTYKPFLATTLKSHAEKYYDIMNVHYTSDLKKVQEVIRSAKVEERPIWITEIGGSSSPNGHTLEGERQQIVQDITQAVMQLAAGAEKVFKYDFRDDGTNADDNESNFGLVYRDFSPKPAYVAQATMIRLLASSLFVRPLNIVKKSDQGWLIGYQFRDKNNRLINVIWLNDAKTAAANFKILGQGSVIDIMGNEKKIEAVSGAFRLTLDDLPIFVIGEIQDAPGLPTYPVLAESKSFNFPLVNPGFEEPALKNEVVGWQGGTDKGPSNSVVEKFTTDPNERYSGKASGSLLVLQADPKVWRNVHQSVSLERSLPKLADSEKLRISVQGWFKMKKVEGRGIGLVCSFYKADGTRFTWRETGYRAGTRDWFCLDTGESDIPEGTKYITVDIYVAPGTTGQVWFDNIQFKGHIWKKVQQ